MASPLTNSKSKPTRSTSRKDPSATTHSTTSQKDDAKGDVREPCGTCDKPVSNDHKALQCDGCSYWHHTGCEKVSNDVYVFLQSHADDSSLQWLCRKCQHTLRDLRGSVCVLKESNRKLDEKVDHLTTSLHETVEKLAKEIDSNRNSQTVEIQALHKAVEGVIDNKVDVQQSLEEVIDKKMDISKTIEDALIKKSDADRELEQRRRDIEKSEEFEIQQRKTCAIVHGLSESGADTPEERVDDDCLQVAAMLSELNITGAQVQKVIRLGKRSTDAVAETNKPRPLKIVFDSEESKVQVLRNAKNLKNKKEGGWERVFVHQDLTPKQREARNILVQELKSRLAQGETDLTIYRGAVVKKRGY